LSLTFYSQKTFGRMENSYLASEERQIIGIG